jgi:cell fate (sporulation/competence/biofilm development) regulator YmcA (YheA/YmcA/DUF963 family)
MINDFEKEEKLKNTAEEISKIIAEIKLHMLLEMFHKNKPAFI